MSAKMVWIFGLLSALVFGPTLGAGDVDYARLKNAAREPQNWFLSGRDLSGGYYSPLNRINDKNVGKLGFAWDYDLGTHRGLEATPVVIDGVMYTSGNWGRVYALDAANGHELWTFDPAPDGQSARNACCDVVNRGVAVWQGRLFVASIDGRLFALDAKTGKTLWVVDTIIDHKRAYTVSGAPQVAKNVVVIGNGGADFGVRGYVSAYDLKSGKFKWRFYTVPGDPKKGFEHPELAAAAKTWDPNSNWALGGGGTVWDSMAYDPDLNLLYVGTGNASPYNPENRSPRGGDNLYLASILAINPDNGRLKWYYQEVPGEDFDYTATQKIILADLDVGGKPRKVLMQAPKDGFFYVLDRESGELISASPYTYVNWASGVDPKTGRPVRTRQSNYNAGPKLIYPSQAGGHNWQPMAYNPNTGLVYIPVIDMGMIYIDMVRNKAAVRWVDGWMDVAAVTPDPAYRPEDYAVFGKLPTYAELSKVRPNPSPRGFIRAFDPVSQKAVWEHEVSTFWDGGVMTTAGNLVFQGRASGELWVYAADSGKVLAKINTGSSIMAAPMTYAIKGEQYVALMAGFGGGGGFAFPPNSAAYKYGNEGRIIAFKLGGEPAPIPALLKEEPMPKPPAQTGGAEAIQQGSLLFVRYCSRCHVMGRGLMPDLRRMTAGVHADFNNILLKGARASLGMGRFDDALSPRDVDAIHAYITDEASRAYRAQPAKK
jgi:quinohemoprotein ethanol dehydrogenase